MSTIRLTSSGQRRIRPLFTVIIPFSMAVFCSVLHPAQGIASEPKSVIKLWDESLKTGQWRAFGLGVLDSRPFGGEEGLSVEVDWHAATFGVGVTYEKGEALTSLAEASKLTFEVRATGDESRTVTAEFGIRASGKAFRASSAKPVTGEWTSMEFEIPTDFPNLQRVIGEIDTLRILFPKEGSNGRGRVEFRNVELRAR